MDIVEASRRGLRNRFRSALTILRIRELKPGGLARIMSIIGGSTRSLDGPEKAPQRVPWLARHRGET